MNLSIRSRYLASHLSMAAALMIGAGTVKAEDKQYQYFVVGDPSAEVVLPSTKQHSSVVLMGGGTDVDEAFRWMISRAGVKPGSGGRFVILRSRGSDAYNPYVFFSGPDGLVGQSAQPKWVGGAALGLTSVETLVIPSRAAANDGFVNEVVRKASAVFIAGGDQSQYIRFWKGTELHRSLDSLLARNAPIGGTSAGLAVLSEYTFAALEGTIDSASALSDPFDSRITFDPAPRKQDSTFLAPAPLLGVIADSHFVRRKRMGRLVTFVSRLSHMPECAGVPLQGIDTPLSPVRGIGVSEQTALLIESTDDGSEFLARRVANPWIRSEGAVYFVRSLSSPRACESGSALTIDEIEIRKLTDSESSFNLTRWSGGQAYVVRVSDGKFDVPPY